MGEAPGSPEVQKGVTGLFNIGLGPGLGRGFGLTVPRSASEASIRAAV